MSRYERGDREPDFDLVGRIAAVLAVPAAFFYAGDDDVATLLVAWGRLKRTDRAKVLEMAVRLAAH